MLAESFSINTNPHKIKLKPRGMAANMRNPGVFDKSVNRAQKVQAAWRLQNEQKKYKVELNLAKNELERYIGLLLHRLPHAHMLIVAYTTYSILQHPPIPPSYCISTLRISWTHNVIKNTSLSSVFTIISEIISQANTRFIFAVPNPVSQWVASNWKIM